MGGPFSFAIYNPISMPDSTGEITSSTESFISQLLTMFCKYVLKLFCSHTIFKNVWVWTVMVNEVRVIGASLYLENTVKGSLLP